MPIRCRIVRCARLTDEDILDFTAERYEQASTIVAIIAILTSLAWDKAFEIADFARFTARQRDRIGTLGSDYGLSFAVITSQLKPNRCKYFLRRSESLILLRCSRLTPNSVRPASAIDRQRW